MFTIDLDTSTVAVLPPAEGAKVACLDSHTAVAVDDNKVLLFGGYCGAKKTNNLYVYSIAENTWTLRKPKEAEKDQPVPRALHTAVLAEGKMYVFGGADEEGDKRDDMWKYDLAQDVWKRVEVAESVSPSARSGHSAAVYQGQMYVFGGILGIMQEVNDFYSFDFKTESWNIVHLNEKTRSEEDRTSPITALKVKKIKEEAKRKQRGEPNSPDRRFGDSIKLRPNMSGTLAPAMAVSPRLHSSMDGMNASLRRGLRKLVPHGTSILYKNAPPDDEVPSPIVTIMKNSVVMKAASSDKKRADHDELHLDPARKFVGKFPCGRDGHSSHVHKDKLYVFGGDRNQMAYNDLYSFMLP